MPRLARIIAPGVPHHITQRGNRRMKTFFRDDDYVTYIDLMAQTCRDCQVEIWAYCLMPNHTHLIALPQTEDGLRRAIGEAHRLYTRMVNFREDWRGHLWQGRFASFPLEAKHLLAAARYVELNPVRAELVVAPADWPWSSAAAHIAVNDDRLVKASPLVTLVDNWSEFLRSSCTDAELEAIHRQERTGRPLGDDSFVHNLENLLHRDITPKKRGPKPKDPSRI